MWLGGYGARLFFVHDSGLGDGERAEKGALIAQTSVKVATAGKFRFMPRTHHYVPKINEHQTRQDCRLESIEKKQNFEITDFMEWPILKKSQTGDVSYVHRLRMKRVAVWSRGGLGALFVIPHQNCHK